MNFRKKLHWFIYPLFVLSCARQTSPTGGPKDTIPPILLKANPTNEQTNYTHRTLELTFDETVILNNPKEQIIITPDVGKEFDAEVKKNKVIVRFKNDLNDNTTYSVNFREAVQDITEKNPAQRLKLAFSTGDYIDSLSIEGKVYDLLRSKEIKDATVALYENDTFNIFKNKPSYLSKTDIKGNFQIENLKPGDYYIYAIEDKNKNLVVDSKSESYGFISEKISLTSNLKDIDIPIIRLDTRPLKLTSARPSGTYFNIKTSKSITRYKIQTNQSENLVSSFGEDMANIHIYNTIGDRDSIAIHLSALDSINNSIDTTLYLKFSKREAKADVFKTSNNGFDVIGTKGLIRGTVGFSKPLLQINFDSIFYQIDSANIIKITSQDVSLDSNLNILFIEKSFDKTLLIKKPATPTGKTNTPPKAKQLLTKEPLKEKARPSKPIEYQLYLAKNSLISIELDSSKTIQETIRPSTLETTGVIIVQIQTQEENYLVQLLTKDFKIVTSTANTAKTVFEDLKPEDYFIRLIIDKNKDGTWSPGNFYTKQQPETAVFYKNEKGQININLKANWELGPLFIKY